MWWKDVVWCKDVILCGVCMIPHGFVCSLMQIRNKAAPCRQVRAWLFTFTVAYFCIDVIKMSIRVENCNLQFSPWYFYFSAVLFQLPGSSATRYPWTVQPFFQVLHRNEFWWPPEAFHQWPPPAAYGQRPGKGKEENKDGPLRIGGFHLRAKERHRYFNGRWGHISEGRRGGETTPATGSSHSQTHLHALR